MNPPSFPVFIMNIKSISNVLMQTQDGNGKVNENGTRNGSPGQVSINMAIARRRETSLMQMSITNVDNT